MDLAKFVWMLQRSALYFCRADMLGDQFEGYYTRRMAKRADEFAIAFAGSGTPPEKARELHGSFLKILREQRRRHFISCWHMSRHDSAAMWRLYTSMNESVAVETSYNSLFNSIPDYAYCGMVKYIDYDRDYIPSDNLYNFVISKRASFAHEQEVRCVVHSWESKPKAEVVSSGSGLIVPVRLEKLVSRVFVSPSASDMFREVVDGLLERYALKKTVRYSPR